ncbi:MAG: PGPGW domain-containing protein [Candidatus Korobacteraceae bacterium]
MVSRLQRIALQVLGWLFVLLGIAGLVLPILQGILFLMIGLYLLSREYPWAQRMLERLQNRYPEVFRQARNWQVRLGFRKRIGPPEPVPLPPVQRILVLFSLAALLVVISLAGQAGASHLVRYWGELQHRYRVVEVTEQGSARVVELRRTWAFKDRHYVVRCHICEPVEVGSSYRFEAVPGRYPPMMKRIAGPGEIPDFYTVLEGRIAK